MLIPGFAALNPSYECLCNWCPQPYRSGGLDAVAGARRILAAVAGSRLQILSPEAEA